MKIVKIGRFEHKLAEPTSVVSNFHNDNLLAPDLSFPLLLSDQKLSQYSPSYMHIKKKGMPNLHD